MANLSPINMENEMNKSVTRRKSSGESYFTFEIDSHNESGSSTNTSREISKLKNSENTSNKKHG